MRKLLISLAVLFAPAVFAQTTVNGTFKTPGGQTPQAAGLSILQTVAGTNVCGQVDFQAYDSAGNRVIRLIWNNVTYFPQRVRGFVRCSDGAIINDTGAAGVALIPNSDAQPSGTVYLLTGSLTASTDGTIAAQNWAEEKAIPDQTSVDWGTLSVAAVASPAFSYIPQTDGNMFGFLDMNGLASAPANPVAGICRFFFNTTSQDIQGVTSTGGNCTPSGSNFGQLQTGTNTTATMTCSTGCSVVPSGTGVINSTEINGVPIPSANSGTAGKIPIAQGDGTAAWSDPLVQGTSAAGATTTGLNPVLIGGKNGSGNLTDIVTDSSGNIGVNIQNTPAVTVSGTATVSGTVNQGTAAALAGFWPVEVTDGTHTMPTGDASARTIHTTIDNASIAITAASLPLPTGAAQDSTVSGLEVSQASTTSGQKGILGQCAVTTSAPSYTTAQTDPLSCDTSGNVRVNVTNTPSVSQSGTWNVGLSSGSNTVGKVDILGNSGVALDAAQNAAAPANELVLGGVFNSSLPTITSGNASQIQLDSSGRMLVNCSAGCGGGTGGTSLADEGAFTQGTTSITPIGGIYSTSITNLTSGQAGAVQLTNDRTMVVTARMQSFNGSSWINASPWPADNSSFTAGTTPSGVIAGWYSTSPTACTSGDLCAPSLTSDRKLYVQAFQGTSPWVTSASQGTAAASTAGWPVIGGNIAESTGAWTSATSANTAITLTTAGYNAVFVTLNQGSTITGGVVTFEGSDTAGFTNAYTTYCSQVNSATFATSYTLVQSANQAFVCNVSGYAAFRVRLSTVISGTGTINVGAQATAFPTQPNENVQGTVTANAGTGTFTVGQATGTNLHIVCDSGCSSSAGFADNSAFTVGTTAINPIGGYYTTGADPTLSTGDAARARIDSHSYLFQDLTAVAGTVLGAPSNYGTSPGAVEVLGVNAFITNTPSVSQSGNWTSRIVGNAGGIMDAAGQNVAQPANELLTGCEFNTSPTTITSGNMSPLQCDNGAKLLVDTGTVTVTGTVTANQGGSNWSMNLAQVGGSAVALGQTTMANSIPVTMASNQSNINVAVNAALPAGGNTIGAVTQASGPWTENLTQLNSVALGSPSNYGTSPGAVAVAGVNAFITNTPSVSQSGTWTVQPGNTANTTPWLVTLSGSNSNVGVTQQTSPWVDNVTQWNSVALGSPSAFGTAPSGNVIGTNSAAYCASNSFNWPQQEGPLSLASGALAQCQMDGTGRMLVHDPDTAYSNTLLQNISTAVSKKSVAVSAASSFGNWLATGADPCGGRRYSAPVSQTASSVVIPHTAGVIWICGGSVVGSDAEDISIVTGTGSACGTGTIAVAGGTTAASGMNFAANGGQIIPEIGEVTAGGDVCVLQSGTGRVAGFLSIVITPY